MPLTVSANKQRIVESESRSPTSRYRIGVLLYFRSEDGRILLIRRAKRPNRGMWCAIGGKLEIDTGESPFECAIREANEEVGVTLKESDLSMRCMLSEENYEGTGHWLMFLFEVHKRLASLPDAIDEGEFGFFELIELADLGMPPLDRSVALGRILNSNAASFSVLKAVEGVENDPDLLEVVQTVGLRGD